MKFSHRVRRAYLSGRRAPYTVWCGIEKTIRAAWRASKLWTLVVIAWLLVTSAEGCFHFIHEDSWAWTVLRFIGKVYATVKGAK